MKDLDGLYRLVLSCGEILKAVRDLVVDLLGSEPAGMTTLLGVATLMSGWTLALVCMVIMLK